MSAHTGRPSIAPEKLLRALLLQVLCTVRSERLLMEQRDDTRLFRWVVGLNVEDPIWDPTGCPKNRERLLAGDLAQAFFERVLAQARQSQLLSDEPCSVDGTLIEAWAGQKSFKKKAGVEPVVADDDPGNPTIDCRGEKRSNATHHSTTDPEARLDTKARGQEATLGYLGHVLMEHRHGVVVHTRLTQATGTAERDASDDMAEEIPGVHRVTLAADKAYDTAQCVGDLAGPAGHTACRPEYVEAA